MLYIICIILLFEYFLERYLNHLNKKLYSYQLPEELKGIYDEEHYLKSQQYERANDKFSLITSTFSLILMLALLLTGSFALLEKWSLSKTTDLVWSTLLFFGVLALASDILQTPFALYKLFVIEEKFGFNRTTLKTFFLDKIKAYLLGGIIGGSLLALFVLFYQLTGNNFWIYTWIAVSIFTMIMVMFYASWILPLFNKLTPLPGGTLRKKIESYCEKVSFKLDNLFVMDGSKRSAKANAFFSGLGAKKKIVLFDTLIEKHTEEELVAVLAHEVGHYKRKHTRLTLLLSILQSGLMLFLLSKFIDSPQLSEAMGGTGKSFVLGLLAFGLLYSPVSMLLSIGMNMLSRKNEYEADQYAAATYEPEPMQSALKKLSVDNLSNLRPHPLYVFFYYSHPTLLQRLGALEKIKGLEGRNEYFKVKQ